MRIYTSYFYQVRFFPPNLIPLSTAKWDPKWFHEGLAQSHQFKDKRGVLNGLRAEPFVPGIELDGTCRGPESCFETPPRCRFQLGYLGQLRQLDFQTVMNRFEDLAERIKAAEGFDDVDFALLLHEAPTNPCSERIAIHLWFAQNNYRIDEWHPNSI